MQQESTKPDLLVPPIPAEVPRKHNPVSRAFGRFLMRLLGWRVTGQFPKNKKVVVAVAPHTSNWDFIIGMAAIMASGVRVNYLMKKEAFFWPFAGFFKWLGGVPVNRKSSQNVVDQIVAHLNQHEQTWVAIAPEGTRQKVSEWKTGFLRVAQQAQVPVLLIAWDFANKEFVLDKLWHAEGDVVTLASDIQNYVNQNFQGKHPRNQ